MVLNQRANEAQSVNLRMRSARAAKGLTQADLSKLVGASRQTVSMIEAGAHNPTLRLCIDIARALDTDLNSLFWEESES
ncbi:helix-turn-helix transcriptional regulator [Kocuria atrinae]|uniref:helix-turn-helix transcriptional regulator n=1 Tax=Kocuria atrinae TaxID=592377 RepID=UPI00035ECD44|nr:helix-turn-helix transcriptional regulator [Kocuria atrinae]